VGVENASEQLNTSNLLPKNGSGDNLSTLSQSPPLDVAEHHHTHQSILNGNKNTASSAVAEPSEVDIQN